MEDKPALGREGADELGFGAVEPRRGLGGPFVGLAALASDLLKFYRSGARLIVTR